MRRRGLRTGGSRRQTGWGRIAVHMTPLHVTMPVLIRFSSSQLSFFFSLSWLCSIIGRDLGSSLKRVHCAAALSPANELLWPNQRRFFFFEAFRFLMWIDSICDGKWHGNENELMYLCIYRSAKSGWLTFKIYTREIHEIQCVDKQLGKWWVRLIQFSVELFGTYVWKAKSKLSISAWRDA